MTHCLPLKPAAENSTVKHFQSCFSQLQPINIQSAFSFGRVDLFTFTENNF